MGQKLAAIGELNSFWLSTALERSVNILLEGFSRFHGAKLQIAQCKHLKGGVDVIMSKFNTPKGI